MNMIYHIVSRTAAKAAQESGEYRAESLKIDGFIHFSQLHQLLGVANSYYIGQKDLVILVVAPSRLRAVLHFEHPVHPGAGSENPGHKTDASVEQLFPHLYGPLNFDAVLKVVDFPSFAGRFDLPAL